MYNNNNMLIFDIGANIGSYSFKKLRSNNNLTIVAIEPLPKIFNTLKINLQHFQNRITLLNLAVSNVKGDIDFYECANTNGSPGAESCSTCSVNHIQNSCFGGGEQGKFMMSDGKTFSEHYKFKDPIKVQTITLDDLIIQYGNPDLIKIDVEGYENSVLKSLTSKSAKTIAFEWHEYIIDEIIDSITHLSKLGYEYFSTEIWYQGKHEHDNEILNYKSCTDFIKWFEPIVRKSISITGDLNKKYYMENNTKINYINCWGMIWVK